MAPIGTVTDKRVGMATNNRWGAVNDWGLRAAGAEGSMRPRPLIGPSGRPLNFTVRPLFGCRPTHREYLHESRTYDHGI